LDEANLTVINGRSTNDYLGGVTFSNNNGTSTIDLLIVNQPALNLIRNLEIGNSPESQHFPLNVQLNINTHCTNTITQKLIKYKVAKTQIYREFLCNTPVFYTYDSFINNIYSTANTIGMSSVINNNKPWFNGECVKARRECYKAGQLAKKHKWNDLPRELYANLKSEYIRIRKNASKLFWSKKRLEINNVRNPIEFWRALKAARYTDSTNILDNNTWITYHNYLPIRNPLNESFFGPDIQNFSTPFQLPELKSVLKHLKSNKAPGPNQLSNEFFKNLPESHVISLLNIYNNILDKEIPPLEWSNSNTSMIFKKGDRNNPENYRPIALLNVPLKIFTSLMNNRINNWIEGENILPE